MQPPLIHSTSLKLPRTHVLAPSGPRVTASTGALAPASLRTALSGSCSASLSRVLKTVAAPSIGKTQFPSLKQCSGFSTNEAIRMVFFLSSQSDCLSLPICLCLCGWSLLYTHAGFRQQRGYLSSDFLSGDSLTSSAPSR